jgi:hypothetical protein
MCDRRAVGAAPYVSEIERFGHVRPEAQAPLRGARWGLADCQCAFIGHWMNAENTAAVIGSLASIAVNYAGVSAECYHVGLRSFGGGAVSTVVQTVGSHLGHGLRDGPMTGRSQADETNSVSWWKIAGGSMRMR